jgi:hypothetical protein
VTKGGAYRVRVMISVWMGVSCGDMVGGCGVGSGEGRGRRERVRSRWVLWSRKRARRRRRRSDRPPGRLRAEMVEQRARAGQEGPPPPPAVSGAETEQKRGVPSSRRRPPSPDRPPALPSRARSAAERARESGLAAVVCSAGTDGRTTEAADCRPCPFPALPLPSRRRAFEGDEPLLSAPTAPLEPRPGARRQTRL